MKLRNISANKKCKARRKIDAAIGFIGILLAAGILFSILMLNSSVAVASDGPASDGSAVTTTDSQALKDKTAPNDKNKVIKKKLEHEERKAAGKRFKEGRDATLGAGAVFPTPVLDPAGIPHYFGPYPNYANSPLPKGVVTGITVINGGNNYTAPVINITDIYSTGTGATVSATITGPVTGITLINGGSGHTSAPVVSITGDGTGATADATITMDVVASIALTAGGAGYTAPAVGITGGGGTGAIAAASGAVDGIIVTGAGSGYTTAIADITGGGGTGATATVSIDPATGAIMGITVTNGGSGYTSAPTVTITGDGTGATADATLTITDITVTSGGSSYTSAPAVTISDSVGTGSGAAATAIVAGPVTGITVTTGGSGYTTATVDITGGGGSGATATATITGPITGITVTNGGSGYIAPAVVTITGATGTGATATATIGGPYTGGIRKFVDSLPGLTADGANNLGQYIPIAVPDTCTYSGQEADCYEIELREYTEKLHSDLSPTKLRGYVQVKNGIDVAPIHHLGPLIVAKRDVPVRIKFTNKLPTGTGGNLFLPVDTTVMGAGPFMIDDPANPGNTITGDFTQNRATLHLHGGFVPWISDGTPHQWITPAGESTKYPKGVSVYNVPDMFYDAAGNPVPPGTPGATTDPSDGSMTFYYNNQQSARLMFYHDHSYGITRLNVYAGEAAGYLLTDLVEEDLINGTDVTGVNPGLLKVLPDVGIPLIIQDKTFVDADTIAAQDPTWNWGTGPRDPVTGKILSVNTGDLWYPHVYMPNQNPADTSGMNAFGRWHYSPFFWPPPTDIANGPVPNPYYDCYPGGPCTSPWEPELMPATPNPSEAAEAFMDTVLINGAVYPNLTVEPKAYRFRILNAADDRFFNLQLYVADPAVVTPDGRTNTEVRMVPAVATAGFPADWPKDGREGGVPDPATAGPSFIQIGTEGGFLPAPVVLPNQPVDWNMDQTNFDMGLVNKGTLILGTAERADVIVDFSAFAGKTLILYNDAPAPFPAIDPRYDYYTGDPDQTDIGGAPSTLPGYGPNTRTIMQIQVGTTVTKPSTVDLATLEEVFAKNTATGKRGVFEVSQDEIIVSQTAYNTAYDKIFPADPFVRIFETSKTFQTANSTPMTIQFQPKAIQDETSETYDTEYGRMSAMLGVTIPQAPGFVPLPYLSPPVEIIKDSVYGTPLGSLGDGTQIWKITHNGVDTHTIHVHLFNAQLINRVAWDNAIRVPDANELGWKETFRVNPLQDTIVAFRPVAPPTPFKVPNSIRLIDPTMPEGYLLKLPPKGFKDPNGNPVTVLNNKVNFGWEYVYHCHLLAHEEMDMMHGMALAVAPDAPTLLDATLGVNRVTLNWTDNSISETDFIVQRNTTVAGTWITIATILSTTGPGTGTRMTYADTTVVPDTTYNYRVLATNVVGDTTVYPAPAIGFPTMSADSAPSGTATVTTPPVAVVAPTKLQATINGGPLRIVLTWTDNSNNENSFAVWRSVNGGAFTQIGTVSRTNAQRIATGGTVTFTNTNAIAALVAGQTYDYYVTAVSNTLGPSLPSNTFTVVFAAPAAPSGLTGTAVRIPLNNAQDTVTLTWTDNSNNEVNFQIQRSTKNTFNPSSTFTVGANAVTFSQNVVRPKTYWYRIRATNLVGNSAWNVFGPLNAP